MREERIPLATLSQFIIWACVTPPGRTGKREIVPATASYTRKGAIERLMGVPLEDDPALWRDYHAKGWSVIRVNIVPEFPL